jgi:hypothetical protein
MEWDSINNIIIKLTPRRRRRGEKNAEMHSKCNDMRLRQKIAWISGKRDQLGDHVMT